MAASEDLSASLEDYIEVIYNVVSEKQAVRAKDIARRLNVKASSVTGALRSLSEKGFINYAPYDVITLTSKGKRIARDVVRRHDALRDFFIKVLSIDGDEAEEAACKLEHAIPRKILDRLIRFMEFVEVCPRGGVTWLKEFGSFCEAGEFGEDCERCIAQCFDRFRQNGRLATE